MPLEYSKRLIEEFRNPSNVGEMEAPDGFATHSSDECGDYLELYLRVEDGRIRDAKFKTFGCAAAIASSSMLTRMAIGKTLDEALQITEKDVIQALEGMPEAKVHCSLLAVEALKKAVEDYRNKNPG
ncbi:MAG: iron-sulfur cluster assembly scaffold protein [bacterium]